MTDNGAMHVQDSCFTTFKESISGIELPQKFTFPFFYTPHPLCVLAARQLQNHLKDQTDWQHDFGIDHLVDGVNVGKMFGVLLVQNKSGEIGFLSAFSGKLAGQNLLSGFVPPVADILTVDSFFRIGEKAIEEINAHIDELENSEEYIRLKQDLNRHILQAENELSAMKTKMKVAKSLRQIARNEVILLDHDNRQDILQALENESKREHFELKDLSKQWKKLLEKVQEDLAILEAKIKDLKKDRKWRSGALQQEIFSQYQFLNQAGETRSVGDIFKETSFVTPPSGAGDCAAPKLLQYAFIQEMKPLALAEFWWGQSPKSEIRKHSFYYPSCKGKCHPILSHMLEGMEVDESPLLSTTTTKKPLDIVYEDKVLLVINKPNEFLSVPGKSNADSVFSRMEKKYPHATGPLIVHRLDRATSGLMLIAKDKDIHKALQDQFLAKSIKKKYVAILEGIVEMDNGTINLPLRVDVEDRPRQLVCETHGKPALTEWKVVERKDNRTRIHFFPITGRTHQLRVHAAHPLGLNIPIVGDELYGQSESRLHLHAESLEFVHPMTKEIMSFEVGAGF